MGELFENILVTINEPKTDGYKKKRQLFLTEILREWHINKLRPKPYPIKRPILSKEAQK